MRRVFILLFLIIFLGCKKDILPKPKAYLSLTYPEKTYEDLTLSRPYSFKVSKMATIINEKNNWLSIKYPKLKASIDITYRPLKNNIRELLTEAEKLVFKHTAKADRIIHKIL